MLRYGWRAYALPVLTVVTVVALTRMGTAPRSHAAAQSHAASQRAHQPAANPPVGVTAPTTTPGVSASSAGTSAKQGNAAKQGDAGTLLASDALPAGAKYTTAGLGTFRILTGTSPVVGSGNVQRYSIDIEDGVTGINTAQYAALVQQVLSDHRSWVGRNGVALQRVDSGRIDFHVTLTSSMTVRQLCGYDLKIETSCYAAAGTVAGNAVNRVVLNDARWVRGDVVYGGDQAAYRIYMINHEDGHALGHMHSHSCLADGLAPVMMQQTIGLKSAVTGQMCRANPWPYPPGVADAPGAEQADTAQNAPIPTMTAAHTH